MRRTKHGFHHVCSKPLLLSTARNRKAQDSIEYLRRRDGAGDGGSKARQISLFEEENSIQNIAAAVVCSSTTKAKRKRSRGAERLSMVAAWIP